MTAATHSVRAELWRPREGDALQGVVVAEFGRYPVLTGDAQRTLVIERADGVRVHVLRAWWSSLHAELTAVSPRPGDHVRLERLPDDDLGRRKYRVERLEDFTG